MSKKIKVLSDLLPGWNIKTGADFEAGQPAEIFVGSGGEQSDILPDSTSAECPSPINDWLAASPGERTTHFRKEFYRLMVKGSYRFCGFETFPFKIPFTDAEGKKEIYRPLALLVRFGSRERRIRRPKNWLVDIYSDEDIRRDADRLIPAWRAVSRFAAARRLRFRIFRDKFFSSDYVRNLRMFRPFHHLEPKPGDWRLIQKVLDDTPRLKVADIVDRCARDASHSKELYETLGVLIERGLVGADWRKRIHGESEVYSVW